MWVWRWRSLGKGGVATRGEDDGHTWPHRPSLQPALLLPSPDERRWCRDGLASLSVFAAVAPPTESLVNSPEQQGRHQAADPWTKTRQAGDNRTRNRPGHRPE